LYRWLFEKQPDARLGHMGHAHCLLQRNEYEAARAETLLWLSRGGRISLGRELLASVKAARDSAQGHTP
jgi:hypothetical protein